jgi:hypothetical protein
LGVMYFTVARLYYGISRQWLATSQVQDMAQLGKGTRLLGVLAIRLTDATPRERRRLNGILDRLVVRSKLGAGRITHMIEDPGFIQSVFSDSMLVYWLLEDATSDWESDASMVQNTLQMASFQSAQDRFRFAKNATIIEWTQRNEWTNAGLKTILSALLETTT